MSQLDVAVTSVSSTAASSEAAAKDPYSGWEQYPEQLANCDPFCYNTEQLKQRLDLQATSLFSDETEVHVIDAEARTQFTAETKQLITANQVEEHCANEVPELRIISIVRKHSLKPLKISRETILKILQKHEIGPCFLDLLFSFRKVDELSEKGQSLWSPVESFGSLSEICYQLRYMERNDHKQGDKWSERQIGVYHRFGASRSAVMILLHAGLNTEAQRRLQEVFSKGQYHQLRDSSPFLLHALIISSYLDNWRWVMDDYGNECLDKEKKGFTVSLHHQSLNFVKLQALRNLQSKLLRDSTILEATRSAITSLASAAKKLAVRSNNADMDFNSGEGSTPIDASEIRALQTLSLKCEGYLRSMEVLQNRANKLTKLLSDALSLQSQDATVKIADSTFTLTQQSVDDNAVVRVITIITLIYLPMQGVATFFGMNLTSLPSTTNRILFAENWWLFIAISIPLTLLTLGVLVVAGLVERRKKQDRKRAKLQSST